MVLGITISTIKKIKKFGIFWSSEFCKNLIKKSKYLTCFSFLNLKFESIFETNSSTGLESDHSDQIATWWCTNNQLGWDMAGSKSLQSDVNEFNKKILHAVATAVDLVGNQRSPTHLRQRHARQSTSAFIPILWKKIKPCEQVNTKILIVLFVSWWIRKFQKIFCLVL